jgi:hypothetical protein
LIAAALVASAFTMLVAAPPAQPALMCWQRVLNAWSFGDLGANYPLRCYRQAVKHLPADVRGYSTAQDDIQRALIRAISDHAKKRTTASTRRSSAPHSLAAAAQAGGGSSRTMLPLPLLILAGWFVAVVSAVLLRRRRRRAPGR